MTKTNPWAEFANPESSKFCVFSYYEDDTDNCIEFYSEDPKLETIVSLMATQILTEPSYKWPIVGENDERALYVLPTAPSHLNQARALAVEYNILASENCCDEDYIID